MIVIFRDFSQNKAKHAGRAQLLECGKYVKMPDFPHDCGTLDTYEQEYVVLHYCGLSASVDCAALINNTSAIFLLQTKHDHWHQRPSRCKL